MKSIQFILTLMLSVVLFLQCDIIEQEDIMPPIACIDLDKSEYKVGEIINFQSCSNNANQYGWLFDDENFADKSTAENPTKVYNTPGDYLVSLTVFNGTMSDQTETWVKIIPDNSTDYANVMFVVNMNIQIEQGNFNPSSDYVDLVSSLNSYGNDEVRLSDSNNDGIYEVTLTDIEVGTFIEYKFRINGNQEESISPAYRTHTVQATGNRLEHVYSDETNIPVDPADYFGIPGWNYYYYTDFDEATGWGGISDSVVTDYIESGIYYVTVGDLPYHWASFSQDTRLPAQTENYDIEMYFRFTQNNGNSGNVNGALLIWAVDTVNWNHNWYGTDPYGNYIIQSNFSSTTWMSSWLSGANAMPEYNLITIRKYEDRYYFFLNQNFLFDVPFNGYVDDMFGFKVGPFYSVEIDNYGIYLMNLSTNTLKNTKKQLQNRIN